MKVYFFAIFFFLVTFLFFFNVLGVLTCSTNVNQGRAHYCFVLFFIPASIERWQDREENKFRVCPLRCFDDLTLETDGDHALVRFPGQVRFVFVREALESKNVHKRQLFVKDKCHNLCGAKKYIRFEGTAQQQSPLSYMSREWQECELRVVIHFEG